jgi:hypothetical protein
MRPAGSSTTKKNKRKHLSRFFETEWSATIAEEESQQGGREVCGDASARKGGATMLRKSTSMKRRRVGSGSSKKLVIKPLKRELTMGV